MTTVFLTGATGFIGRAVCQKLLNLLGPEARLLLLVRKPIEIADRRIALITSDLESVEKVAGVVREADFIIHIAGEARLYGGQDYHSVNVAATRKLIDFAQEGHSLQRFIFISSVAAMDRLPGDLCDAPITSGSACFPTTEYGKSKLLAEESLLKSGLPYTVFRPGCVYGKGMRNDSHLRRLALLLRKGVPLHRFAFPGKVSLIHVEDLASSVAACLSGTAGLNRVYLAETESMSFGDALSLLGKALFGGASRQLHVPSMGFIFRRFHSGLPVAVVSPFLGYYWMEDPAFRCDLLDNRGLRLLRDNSRDITDGLAV